MVTNITTSLTDRRKLFIGGQFVDSEDGKVIDILNPTDQSVVGQTTLATPKDMEKAITAARRSFDDGRWHDLSGSERARIMRRAADILESRFEELAVLLTAELGCPLWFSRAAHAVSPIKHTRYYAGLAESYPMEELRSDDAGLQSIVRQEPVGVVGAITPWNGPMSSPSLKIMPALAAGCSVVLKPPTHTPLSPMAFADAFAEAGLPAGVLNILPSQRDAATLLVEHPSVDKLAFTGSTETGKSLLRSAADRVARVTLELGGKSAAIALDDADPQEMAKKLLPMALAVNGQLCISQARVLVPRSREREFTEAFEAELGNWTVGDPMADDTKIGPMVSEDQQKKVLDYLEIAKEEGANLLSGGLDLPEDLSDGWFVPPTLLAGASNSMRAVREEIFGPVIALLAYEDTKEAIDIANDSPYGLSGSVWGVDEERALEVARQIRTGMVSINGAAQSYGAPFGGFKQSGIGREMGPEGYKSYLETKSIAVGTEYGS